MADRIRRRMVVDRKKVDVTIKLPEDLIEDMKDVLALWVDVGGA